MRDLQVLEEHISNLSRSIDYIEQHIEEQFTMLDLAKQARMSVWHFQKVFHILVGEPVKTYVRRRRLTHASKLLIDSEISLDSLAAMAGFKSQEAFNRAFKLQFQLTPGVFRKARTPAKTPHARASINEEYIANIFAQTRPPQVDIRELPSMKLLGIQGHFYSCFSDDADGPKIIPSFWKRLDELIDKNKLTSILSYWGVVTVSNDTLGETDQSTYAATFETDLSNIAHEKTLCQELLEYDMPGGLYAVFKQQNPAAGIVASLNYVFCIWLNQSDYQLDDRAELENYAVDYSVSDLNSYFTYGIPVKTKA